MWKTLFKSESTPKPALVDLVRPCRDESGNVHGALVVAPSELGQVRRVTLPGDRSVDLELPVGAESGTRVRMRGVIDGADVYLHLFIADYL